MILPFSSLCHNHDHYYTESRNDNNFTAYLQRSCVVCQSILELDARKEALRLGAGVQILMNPTMTGLIKENYQGKWFPF